jgi:hypothetical protein
MRPVNPKLPICLKGPWSVEVGGTLLDIPRNEIRQVRDERHDSLPLYKEGNLGYSRGRQLIRLLTEECTGTGMLIRESVQLKPAAGNSAPFIAGKDYRMDYFWGTFGRVEGSSIQENQTVYMDYDYSPCRLDSIVQDAKGKIKLISGTPKVGSLFPVKLNPDETLIANVWVDGPLEKLTAENLFPVDTDLPPIAKDPKYNAENLLPKTLAKLRAGKNVTYVAWGDSVSYYCNYQAKFTESLRTRFPQTSIILQTAAWPGNTSDGYMKEPAGGKYDFVRDVLDKKPDLVSIEFVNDACLNEEQTQKHYALIMEKLSQIGAEVILIVPHFVRPDWMGMNTMKFDEDPRPYVKGLRKFAADRRIAIAEASNYWARLWRQGIPYITLQVNSINHPDDRGHQFFAQALIDLFPEK